MLNMFLTIESDADRAVDRRSLHGRGEGELESNTPKFEVTASEE
jgi:hypothetical protein